MGIFTRLSSVAHTAYRIDKITKRTTGNTTITLPNRARIRNSAYAANGISIAYNGKKYRVNEVPIDGSASMRSLTIKLPYHQISHTAAVAHAIAHMRNRRNNLPSLRARSETIPTPASIEIH